MFVPHAVDLHDHIAEVSPHLLDGGHPPLNHCVGVCTYHGTMNELIKFDVFGFVVRREDISTPTTYCVDAWNTTTL